MFQILQKLRKRGAGKGRLIRLMSLAAAMVLMLAGCGKSAEKGVSLQLSTWGSAQEVAVLKSLLAEFEKTHPDVHVDLLHIPENYYQKLHILVAGDMTPDVIFTNSISFPIYASQGIFMDLQPYLTNSKKSAGLKREDFYPAALKAFNWQTADGKQMLGALPRDISNVVIFYNRDLFAKAGVPEPKAGWTWEQFRETADQLTVDQNNDGDPDQFGISFYSTPPLFWLPFVWSAGGNLFSDDLKQVTLDQPEAVKGLQYYADLRNQWHVAPKKVESGGATMSQLFMQQKLAMMVNGRWSVPVLRDQAKFRWDVVPLPVGPSGKSRVGIDASGYAISAKTPHPKESLALVEFLLSRPAIEKVTESGLIVPARPDVAVSSLFLSPRQAPAHGRVFLDVISDGVPTHTPPRWNELSEELNLALEPVWDGTQNAALAVQAVKPRLQHLLEVSP
jgi:multiple sugar transport system substrate-binding protein